MSLILEALRKLERDKPAPERGVVVMTSAGLDPGHRRPWLWLAFGIVTGVVGVLALGVWLGTGQRRGASASPAPPAPNWAEPEAVKPPPTLAAFPEREPRPAGPRLALPAANKPAVTPAPSAAPATTNAAPALVLQAITQSDGKPIAMIGDRLYHEGDEFAGMRVLRIGEAEVEIEVAGHRSVLRF